MNIIMMVLMIFGSIFLGLVFFLAVFLLLFYIWGQRISRKFDGKSNKSQNNGELVTSDMKDFDIFLVFDIFSDFPILGNLFKKKFADMKDGTNFFNNLIPQILDDWNPQDLRTNATQKLLNSLEIGEPEKSFQNHFYNLGKLREYKGVRHIKRNYYFAEAAFEQGLAQIQVELIKDEDKWLINNFTVICKFQLQSN